MDTNFGLRDRFLFSETVDTTDILTNYTAVQRTVLGGVAFPWNFEIISEEIQSKMFTQNEEYGSDLIAMDVVRGRDCCLKPYIHYLDIFQGECIDSWRDLSPFMEDSAIDELQMLFKEPRDIDLYTGGSVEKRDPDPLVHMRPVFKRITVEQYKLLKRGDPKFWNRINNASQRAMIKSLTFGDLLCIAFKLTKIPKDAKMAWSAANPLVNCRYTKLEDAFNFKTYLGSKCT